MSGRAAWCSPPCWPEVGPIAGPIERVLGGMRKELKEKRPGAWHLAKMLHVARLLRTAVCLHAAGLLHLARLLHAMGHRHISRRLHTTRLAPCNTFARHGHLHLAERLHATGLCPLQDFCTLWGTCTLHNFCVLQYLLHAAISFARCKAFARCGAFAHCMTFACCKTFACCNIFCPLQDLHAVGCLHIAILLHAARLVHVAISFARCNIFVHGNTRLCALPLFKWRFVPPPRAELPWDQPSDSCQEYSDWKERKTYLPPWKKIHSAPLGKHPAGGAARRPRRSSPCVPSVSPPCPQRCCTRS